MSKSRRGADGAAVVDLRRFRKDAASAVAAVEVHWEAIRNGCLVPARSDVAPAELERYLSQVFILERVARGQARFRVVGSKLTDLAGHDLRGMPLSALFAPSARRLLGDAVASVMEEPARIRLALDGGTMTLLPLRSDLGDVTRILGAVDLPSSPSSDRPEFDIRDCAHQTLIGYARPMPTSQPAPHPRRVRPAAQSVRRGPLRLIVDNDAG